MHNVNATGDAVVTLTKRTVWVRNVNVTGEIAAKLTKCTLAAVTAPHFPTQRR